jgi:ribosomal protein S18 acetylase RimI-like enzyme
VGDTALDVYVASFVARGAGARLVTDDRAYAWLAAALPDLAVRTLTISARAPRCTELVARAAGWSAGKRVTAMVCRDLGAVPRAPLPSGLTARPVEDLDAAAAVAMRADATLQGSLAAFTGYLRSLDGAVRLLEAVDDSGAVRATSGCRVFGAEASVFFVNTDPDWQRRGIGRAMTAAALRAAQDLGAARACLDASEAGAGIYRSLGFEDAGPWTQFFSRRE